MPDTKFGLLPTNIGSVPVTDPGDACAITVKYLRDVPAWPQLPKRSFLENMYVQYSEGFPGIVIDKEAETIHVDKDSDLDTPLEALYSAYLENDFNKYGISREYAAGLHAFLNLDIAPRAVKGQVTGPVSWGLTITDFGKRSVIYDEVLADAVARLLRLKATWQEAVLRQISRNTIIFIDEPYMSSFGSAFIALSKEQVLKLLEEVLGGLNGLKGLHCCGNTDWSILLGTSADIIHTDTYNYTESLSLYPAEVKKFIDRGGAVAWGIVPVDAEDLARETTTSLKDRLEEAMAPFTRHGVPFKKLVEQGMLAPSCGLTPLGTREAAVRALELLDDLSDTMRRKYL